MAPFPPADDTGPPAVLLIRRWPLPSAPDGVCARLVQLGDPDDEETTWATAAGIEDICAAVRHWLRAGTEPARRTGDGR